MGDIVKGVALLFIFSFLGIFFAIVEAWMWTEGVVLDQIGQTYTTITLGDLMFFTFFAFFVIGLLLSFVVGIWRD